MIELSLVSHAKINLGLRIVGKRADGYHLIDTIFQEVAFGDILTFRRSGEAAGLTLTCTDPRLPLDGANLCVQAFQLLRDRFPEMGGVHLSLEKHIPVGAGLGGGSSNAAVTLLGLARLFRLPVIPQDLLEMATALGADVPFFLYGGLARGRGIGERIDPVRQAPGHPVVLVIPDIHVSTAWAYRQLNYGLTNRQSENKLKGFFENWEDYRRWRNEFEAPVIKRYSEIGEILQQMHHHQADFASLSGSGSAIFGIFPDAAAAEAAADEFARFYRCVLTRPVIRHRSRMDHLLSLSPISS